MDPVSSTQNQDITEHVKCQENCQHPSNVKSHVWTFECAWEVANKVGGIYTVIRSKTGLSVEMMKNQYVLLGPYKGKSSREEIDEFEFSPGPLYDAVCKIRDAGLQVHTGTWLVDGNPVVILFDIASASNKMNYYKQELFEKTNIGIPDSDVESNDSVLFGFMVAQFLAEFSNILTTIEADSSKIVCHFHEWLSGIGLIMLRLWEIKVATVFTTHATLLGRYLCAGSTDFYNNLNNFNIDIEAGNRQIYQRYCLERAAAHMAHVFTTVSDITAMEAECLLKRKPDVITPNGLNIKRFSALHEFQNLHAINKEKIHDFVRGHFYGHLDFDLTKTLYFFIAGRYEFGNKGVDIFIESLARLNHLMKESGTDVTVLAFIILPAKTNNFNVESLKGQAVAKSLKDTIENVQKNIGKKLFELCLSGQMPESDDLLSKDDVVRLKRCLFASHRSLPPPITTHNIAQDDTDQVLNALRRCQLLNNSWDRVKVVFHPEFLSSTNPLFNLDYEEFIRGCNLGVFPSYYEPWGYTPAECTVMGIPSITTNLSGFGCFMADHIADPESYGIHIVDRQNISLDESINQLTRYMLNFTLLTERQRVIQRNRTERLSEILDWENLFIYYKRARLMALSTVYSDTVLDNEEGSSLARQPHPVSEPESSRPVTTTVLGSQDEVDNEKELEELGNRASRNI
ncbi:glycogen [starch] synthase-like [Artemia franciscana]|uniref:Glycogen [starch] synthase n=1 Tax=Artemia franciscana TaxID=6661 RepID=A0AA88IE01_ARTSF|nr:hypothetical protein QYM36_000731 [Artemia franciscana]